jgi:hypothetical protein
VQEGAALMTREEFELKRGTLKCAGCGESGFEIVLDAPPPHAGAIKCSCCGRHFDWLAKEPAPGVGDSGEWRRSKNGNLWRKLQREFTTVFRTKEGKFKWVRKGEFSAEAYPTEEAACAAAEECWR